MTSLFFWWSGLLWRFKWPVGIVLALVLYSIFDKDVSYYKQLTILILVSPLAKLFCIGLALFDYLIQMKDTEINLFSPAWFYKAISKAFPTSFFWISMYFIKYSLLSLFDVPPFDLPFDTKTHFALIIFSGQFIISQLHPMWQFAVYEFNNHLTTLKSNQVKAAPNATNEKESTTFPQSEA